jgi:hypothetical protein
MRAESTVFRPPSSKLDLVGRRLHRPARGLRSLRLVEASLHLGVITPIPLSRAGGTAVGNFQWISRTQIQWEAGRIPNKGSL